MSKFLRAIGFARRHHIVELIVVAAVFCIYVLGAVLQPAFWSHIDGKSYDMMFRVRGDIAPAEKKVVIVEIDEKSLSLYGQWPWPRKIMAALVDMLNEHGAKAIGIDILYPEPTPDDAAFARALARSGSATLAFMVTGDGGSSRIPSYVGSKSALRIISAEGLADRPVVTASGAILPARMLLAAKGDIGHIHLTPDQDGVSRRIYPVAVFDRCLLPYLGVKVAASYLGAPPEDVLFDSGKSIHIGDRIVPLSPDNTMLVNYYGAGQQAFTYVSVADILQGKVGREQIGGRAVVIGATAAGLFDLRVSPVAAALPGVETHANVVASILDQRYIIPASEQWPYVLCVAILLLLGFCARAVRSRWFALLVVVPAVLPFAISAALFTRGVWLPYVWQSIAGLGAIFAVAIYRYGVEESSARRIKALFSSYVSAKIVDELVRNPHLARVGGHRREVSVVFADIVGFSTYAERVSPEQVVDMLNEVLREMSEIILRWDGCLNKFVGDCIVAFWNAPVEQPDHAVLAARCVMNMEKRMGELQAKWRAEGKPPIDIGIGVNTGEVLVGNIGIEGKKMDYTVIGDHVNLAARVEHLTREYGNRVLITEYTHRKIFGDADHGLGHIAATYVDRVRVKGREQEVVIYRLIDTEKVGIEQVENGHGKDI